MKKHLLASLFIILCFASSKAQVSTFIQWQKSLGGTGDDAAYSISQTNDGNYIVAGETASNNSQVTGNHGSVDFWVVKLNSDGSINWQKTLGGTGNDYGRSIKQTTDGGYIVAGYTNSNNNDVTGNNGNYDFWVVKLDGTGLVTWEKTLGGSSYDYAYSVQETFEGGFIVAGATNSTGGYVTGNHGNYDCWVVKLSNTGNVQWQHAYGGSGDDYGYAIQQTTDSGYIVAGATTSDDGDVNGNHGLNDSWVFKIDNGGNLLWQKCLGGSLYDYAQDVQQTLDGGYIVAGYTSSADGDVTSNNGNDDYWLVKLDNGGTLQWQKTYGGSQFDEAYAVQQTADSGYIVAGQSNSIDGDVSNNHGNYDYWIVKTDVSGNIQTEKCFGGTGNDYAYSITQTAGAGFIVAGESDSNDGDVSGNHGLTDFWVVKLTPIVGLAEKSNPVSAMNAYPNPVSNIADISFSLSQSENTSIKIYDVTGRELRTLAEADFSQGLHNLTWNLKDNFGNTVENGIYLLTIETPDGRDSKRVAVMK